MRIIAGELRGRRIDAPEGESTRPMLDRVREAVFSTLGEHVVDAEVLDLFAGSGALGIEALSRGARHVRFLERGAPALAVLKQNLEELGLRDKARVIRGDALAPRSWHDKDGESARYSLVFMDPPYPMVDDPNTRVKILASIRTLFETTLTGDALVVVHVSTRASETLRFGLDVETDLRTYGSSTIAYLTRASG